MIAQTTKLASEVEDLKVLNTTLTKRVKYLERGTKEEPFTRSCGVNVNEEGRSKAAVAKGKYRVAQEIKQFLNNRYLGDEDASDVAMLNFLLAPQRRTLLEKARHSSGT